MCKIHLKVTKQCMCTGCCLHNEWFLKIVLFSYLGMNKMVINHLEKLFVTNDAATILRELEVNFLASEDVSCEPVFLLMGCYDLTVSKEMSLPDDLHMSLWKSLFSLNLRSTVKNIIVLWSSINSCRRCLIIPYFAPKPVGLEEDMSRNAVVWKSLRDIAVELISQCCWLLCSPDCLESINWI